MMLLSQLCLILICCVFLLTVCRNIRKRLRDKQSTTESLAGKFKTEHKENNDSIKLHTKSNCARKDTINNLQKHIRIDDNIISILEENTKLSETRTKVSSGLENYQFLVRQEEYGTYEKAKEYKCLNDLFSPIDKFHYHVEKSIFHSDENKLSNLRVKLYEQLQTSPEIPLLQCACCNRPVVLSGCSGKKGQIVGFRHFGEGNSLSGEYVGEAHGAPKQESSEELSILAECFSSYRKCLIDYKRYESFLLLPGTQRTYPGDVVFYFGGRKIAVIFVSAGHPLDFIVRRCRYAVENGCTPLWLLSESYFYSTGMSIRDISVFSNGYVSTIDKDTVNLFNQTGKPCLYTRDYHNDIYSFITLSTAIEDAGKAIEELINRPIWQMENEPIPHHIGIITRSKSENNPRSESLLSESSHNKEAKKPRYSHSVIDYWAGKRVHIKEYLYVEKIGSTYGIVNLEIHRYQVLPIYDDIRLSDDKSEAELIKDGIVERTVKL